VRAHGAGANDHIVVVRQDGYETVNVLRIVLTIGVEKDQDISMGGPRARLYRGAIPFAVRVAQHCDAVAQRNFDRGVSRSVIDDENFFLGQDSPQPWKELLEGFRFVLGR
jgi:hypothetical protein